MERFSLRARLQALARRKKLEFQLLLSEFAVERFLVELSQGYADTWRLLLEYDEDRLALPPGTQPSTGVLDHEQAAAFPRRDSFTN